MKFKQLLLLSFSALAISGPAAMAQNQKRANWCATDEHYLELQKQFPAEHRQRMAAEAQIQKLLQDGGQIEMRKSGPVRVIPLVIHVITEDGTGGISKAQVLDGVRIMNEDFRRQNADATSTRSVFQPVAADLEIEFRLAQIDPNGNCTEGITRDASVLTNSAVPRDAIKSAVPAWDPNRYFNIWLVKSIDSRSALGGGTILGYAQFPGSGQLNTYGFVCRQDYWGSIGTANGKDGRTATHELGHCINLYHTFQGGCGSNCENSGDLVCDTPPAAQDTYGCSQTLDNCSNDAVGGSANNPNPYTTNVVTQIENYMSYDACQNMFTAGQRNRANAAFNTYPFLQNLVSANNLLSTGTNDGYVSQLCKPIANFSFNPQRVCAGNSVSFTNATYNADATPGTTYSWNFQNAVNPTANTANATATWTTPGTYNVTLTVNNASGNSSVTKQIRVGNTTGGDVAPYDFGFEPLTFPANGTDPLKDWQIEANSTSTWESTSSAAIEGSRSVRINHSVINTNIPNYLYSPVINRSNIALNTGMLKFKVAYKQRNSGSTVYADELKVSFSPDCGATWFQRYAKKGSTLSTSTGNIPYTFVPTSASEWREETINLSSFPNSSTLMIRFESVSDNGNVLYLDDVRVTGTLINGVEEAKAAINFSVFPNPMTDETAITFDLKKAEPVSVSVTDVVGKVVLARNPELLTEGAQSISLNNANLKAGMYLVTVQIGETAYTSKLVVQ